MSTRAGEPGTQGNITDFPEIYSGAGNSGNGGGGYAGASGGGASGGGGGYGSGNHSSSRGGGGGGGAGGSPDAGGGSGGYGYSRGENGYNYRAYEDPTDTTDENATYGVTGNYGIGGWGWGTANGARPQQGTGGFVLIKKIS